MSARIEMARFYFCAQSAVQAARRGDMAIDGEDIAEIIALHNAMIATGSPALRKAAMRLPVVVATPTGAA